MACLRDALEFQIPELPRRRMSPFGTLRNSRETPNCIAPFHLLADCVSVTPERLARLIGFLLSHQSGPHQRFPPNRTKVEYFKATGSANCPLQSNPRQAAARSSSKWASSARRLPWRRMASPYPFRAIRSRRRQLQTPQSRTAPPCPPACFIRFRSAPFARAGGCMTS